MPLFLGQIIDAKYRVVRLIGEGGMGTVYEGENVRIGRRVAIKVLNAQFATRPELMARFEREARAAARIGSANICDVLDLGDLPNNERFIVMEFLEGQSLEQRLTQRVRLTLDEFVPIAYELLEALATMHEAGVIHRDLKPANVHLARTSGGRGEVVKVLDFGVSKFLPFEGDVPEMTATGMLMGTPLYMSPEQAKGARTIDARSDLYSASVIFYRALTGVLPFVGRNFNELLFKIVLDKPRPLRELAPGIDSELAEIIHKGLSHEPGARHASAHAYQEAIASWARRSARGSITALRIFPSERVLAAQEAVPSSTLWASPDGTPTAWSEPGPTVSPEGPPRPGGNVAQVLVERGVAAPGTIAPRVSEAAPEIPRKSMTPLLLTAAAIVVSAALAVGYGLRRSGPIPGASSPPPPMSESLPPSPPPPLVSAPEVEAASARHAHDIPSPAPTLARPSLRRAPPPPTTRIEPSPPTPSATASEPPPSPSAAPTSSSKHRKYRTTLD